MSSNAGPVIQRALLSAELQKLRKEAGKTQEYLAGELDWSVSKLIRIEGGNQGVSAADIQHLLRHLGIAEGPRAEELVQIAKGTRERAWWSAYPIGGGFAEYLGYEMGFARFRQYESLVVPGLLQTPEYARIILGEYNRGEKPSVIDSLVDLRIRRQEMLAEREPAPSLRFVIDEGAVHRRVGSTLPHGRDIMPNQLRQIVELSQRPNIEIGIIPFSVGAHFGMRGSFIVLEFDIEGLEGVLYREDAGVTSAGRFAEISDYQERFAELYSITLSAEESRELMLRLADEMSS